jgi:hypothetical protein
MKIGDTIYYFDQNHRVYEEDENGKSFGGPIWIKHWRERKIIGETKVSWLVGFEWKPDKVNKKKLAAGELGNYCASWDQIEEAAWVHANRWKIVRLLEWERSYDKIKEIAKILDYEEGK